MSSIASGPSLTPFLWFNGNADEAVTFYTSVFPDSRRVAEFRTPVDTPGVPTGGLLTIDFELQGLRFTALNGGPQAPFNESVSFVVNCDTQAEIDRYWSSLLEGGGQEIQCGWLQDRFGLRWQITPTQVMRLLRHPAAMQRMMSMVKLDIAELEAAARS